MKVILNSCFLNFIRFFMISLLAFPFPVYSLDNNTLPTGGEITSGEGLIHSSGSSMTVNQGSERMVANWSTFDIGKDASVVFQQPGSSSVALNRINDQKASEILGSLSANGQIFLLNPNGVIFGSSAQVDVGGLVASSLDLSDENFLKGKYAFEGSGGSVSNLGAIRANGGYVAFLSPQVKNEGGISASGGSVVLAAGDKANLSIEGTTLKDCDLNPSDIQEEQAAETSEASSETALADTESSSEENISSTEESVSSETDSVGSTPAVEEPVVTETVTTPVNVDFTGDQLVQLTVDETTIKNIAENKGIISADGGMVVMTAKAVDAITQSVVNNTGIIEAKGISEQGGKIVLDAIGGETTVSGTLDVSSDTSAGGSIVTTGDYVLIEDGAHLNASGALGGGEVLVGGSWQGKEESIHEATGTIVKQGAVLEANATNTGNGGTVVVWSDTSNANSVTRAYGTFEAKGGVNGGDGGRIETSGHWLDTAGAQGSASSTQGESGLWLFDPYNVTISGVSANGGFAGGIWTPIADNSTILNTTINGLLEGGTSVLVSTYNGGAGGQIGDITISSAITKASGDTHVSLTLRAANSIVVDQAISNTGGSGKLHVILDADHDNGTGNGAGIVLLNADITTGGGDLSFGTGRTATINSVSTLVGGDVYVAGAGVRTLSTNGGAVNVQGEMIIANTNGLTINTNGGNVHFYGLLNSGNTYEGVTYTGTWTDALSDAGSGSGISTGDTYLATITSRLENAVASRNVSYEQSWLGGRRVTGLGTNALWRWVTGPEGAEDSNKGLAFFSQNTGGGGSSYNGGYSNWSSNEPNNYMGAPFNTAGTDLSQEYESVLQFTGTQGFWNDLTGGSSYNVLNTPQSLDYYVKETNLANSPVTINAGAGTVTFDKAVGTSKALKTLTVDATTTAINGGAVTTDSSGGGAQSYSGDITLGSSSTVLTMRDTPTNFTLASGKSITNQSGGDASLTIKTTACLILDDNSSISSSSGKLNTTLHADSDANGGSIFMDVGSAVHSNGGNIVLSGGADVSTGYAKGINSATGVLANGITLYSATLDSDGGNITMRGAGSASFTEGVLGRIAHGVVIGQKTGQAASLVDSGSGKIAITGLAFLQNENGTDYSDGVRIGTVDGSTNNLGIKVTSSSSAADAITITGNASGSTLATSSRSDGIFNTGTIQNTGGGTITLSGIGGSSTTNAVGFYNSGNILSTGHVAITGQAGSTGNDLSFTGSGNIGSAAGTDVLTTSGNTTLTGNTLGVSAGSRFKSTGELTVAVRTAGTTIGIGGGVGTLSLPASYFFTNFTNGFSGITIGSAAAGAITVGGATTLNDSTTLWSNSAIAIGGVLTANENLSLTGSGAIGQSAALAVTGTTTITAGVANAITLSNVGNDFTGAVGVVSGNNVLIIDADDLTLGVVNATGTVDISTLTGDLTLTGAISSANATAGAITLNAGRSTAAGTLSGGNIIISGGSVTTGAGGRATLYSGGVGGSTGLTDLIGSSTGRFRYNSDETASNYSLALGTGNYAIYREQPWVTVTAANDGKTYDGSAYSGGNGVTFSGVQNGDTAALFAGALVYGGTSQGAVNPGSFSIIPSGYTDQLGYSLVYASGTLSITGTLPEPEPSNPPETVNPPSSEPTPPSEPSVPETEVYEPIQDSVNSGLTSTQTGVNGTQNQESGEGADNSFIPDMGAGTGSVSIETYNSTSLLQENLPQQGEMIFSSPLQTTPVQFEQQGEGMTLYLGGSGPGESSDLLTTLPFFIQEEGSTPVSQGVFEIKGGESSLSLLPCSSDGILVPEEVKMDSLSFVPFSLTLPNGDVVEIKVSVSENGFLVISMEGDLAQLHMNQIVLMSLQTARTELKADLPRLKGIKAVKK